MTRISKSLLLIAAPLLGLAPAHAVPATAAGTPMTTAPAPTPKRFPGVSDDGNAVLAKAQTTPDPQLQTLGRQARAAHDQLMSAAMAPVIDLDKVTAAVRAEEAAQTALRAHNNDRLLAVLKQLPDGDRGTFLRTLMLSRQSRPAGAAPAPATPQP